MHKKLYKSRNNRVIAGVCAGLAEYFNVDVTVIRVAWAILSLFGGGGIIAYILCMIIIPEKPLELL